MSWATLAPQVERTAGSTKTMTETTTTGLTTEDIKKLRTSDQIYFHYKRYAGGTSRTSSAYHAPECYLEAIKDQDKNNPWQQRHRIDTSEVVQTKCYDYDRRVTGARCVLYVYSWDQNPLNTFLDLLRVGDVIIVTVIADSNNDYHKKAGLHHDELWLGIARGKKHYVFNVYDSTTPENLARFCKTEAI